MEKYFYLLNFPVEERGLAQLEVRSLFEEELKYKHVFSNIFIEPSRSPFIKEAIKIFAIGKSLNEIVMEVNNLKLESDEFKVNYLRLDYNEVSYDERLEALREVGRAISGKPNIKEPKKIYGLTKVDGLWCFGEYLKNDYNWHRHWEVPNKYSNALPARMARALVNIAVGNNKDLKVIDPCCGIGTVVIEGLSMGINIVGIEINNNIAYNAKKNLLFLGYNNVIKNLDMRNIHKLYDVAIVDLPYNLFTQSSMEDQIEIIKKTKEIAKKAIIISFQEIDEVFQEIGFTIAYKVVVPKNKVKRVINVLTTS